jgi:hypothetical protein
MSQDQQGQLFQTKLNEISLEDIFESNCLTKLDDQRVQSSERLIVEVDSHI